MTNLVKRVSKSINKSCCVKSPLSKDGCDIKMTGVPTPKLIIDFDKCGSPLPSDQTRCDYFLIAEDQKNQFNWVALLELKSGRLNSSKVIKQLRAGAVFVEKVVPNNETIKFVPIVVSSGIHKIERRKLKEKSNAIKLHGQKRYIRQIQCGSKLMTALKS